MLGTIESDLDGLDFGAALVLLGIGMGLIASQLGNVVTSSVPSADRGEAGGLQYTFQQLGSAMGTALIGAVVIGALVGAFTDNIESDDRIAPQLSDAIEVQVAAGANFVAAATIEEALVEAGVAGDETAAVIERYSDAQLQALRTGLLFAGVLAVVSLTFTRNLPAVATDEPEPEEVDSTT